MATEIKIALKHPRGSIRSARAEYDQALNDDNQNEFRAWIYLGKGQATYAEMQATIQGHYDIRSFYEYGDDPDVGPRYIDMGRITHRSPIQSLKDWKQWLREYVSGTDPRDAFRTYRKTVKGG